MDDIRLKFYQPVATGTAATSVEAYRQKNVPAQEEDSFQAIFQKQLNQSSGVAFSKHAVKRALDHNLELSDENLARLNEGVKLAHEKDLDDTLILVDKTAFLVSVKNNTVITAMDNSELKGNVFTNINGTVII